MRVRFLDVFGYLYHISYSNITPKLISHGYRLASRRIRRRHSRFLRLVLGFSGVTSALHVMNTRRPICLTAVSLEQPCFFVWWADSSS